MQKTTAVLSRSAAYEDSCIYYCALHKKLLKLFTSPIFRPIYMNKFHYMLLMPNEISLKIHIPWSNFSVSNIYYSKNILLSERWQLSPFWKLNYFDRSINDNLLSTYYDCIVYSHSLTNKKKRPTSNARWYLWGKIMYDHFLLNAVWVNIWTCKIVHPFDIKKLQFIIDYFIKTKITIWSMVHSTLRKVTDTHKIKADSLMIC